MPTIQQQINANNQTPQQQQQPTQTKQPQNLSEYKQQLKDTEQNLEEQKRKAKQRMVELGRIGRVNPRQRKSERTYYQNVKGQINKALPSIQQEISDVSGAEQVMAEIESGMITTTAQISPQASRFIDTQKADEYLQQKAEYDSQVAYNEAYNNVIKHYESGMLWAVAAYGEGLEQEIAKKMIKEGYSPSLGGLLETEQRQKLREQKQALTILNENLYSSAQGMSIAPELSTKQFIFPTGQVSTNEFLKGENKAVQEAVSVNKGLFGNITGFSMFPLVSASGPAPAQKYQEANIFSEVERYQDFGYSVEESKVLAKESMKKGGMTFTPTFAQELVTTQKLKNQQFIDLVSGNGSKRPEFAGLENIRSDWSNPINTIFPFRNEFSRNDSNRIGNISNLGNNSFQSNLVSQGFSSFSQDRDKETSGKSYESSFFGKLTETKDKVWDWTRENIDKKLPLSVGNLVPFFKDIAGEDISFFDIQKGMKKQAQDTLSVYDVQKKEKELGEEWDKQVQRLNINPYTNEWIGSEKDYKEYQKKYEEYETDKKITDAYSLKEQYRTQFVDFMGNSVAPFVPTGAGTLAIESAAVYGGVKLGAFAVSKAVAWAPTTTSGMVTKLV
jgi:hypothetical protein